ncbi:unnamed protein product [Adineta ricciae]|uniref:Uncharacterized protein n=1 Tax=Adineta ricciae TaxID=249248 RepID=A0A814VNT8_ADIRI|nr:unnamed protein product [Adineta ricciae]
MAFALKKPQGIPSVVFKSHFLSLGSMRASYKEITESIISNGVITLITVLLLISKYLWCEGFHATVLTRKGHLNIRGTLVLTKSHMG